MRLPFLAHAKWSLLKKIMNGFDPPEQVSSFFFLDLEIKRDPWKRPIFTLRGSPTQKTKQNWNNH